MTAPGAFDQLRAPDAKVYPAVEIHANLIAGLLDGTPHQRSPCVLVAELASLLLIGIAMTVLLILLSPLRATLFTVLASMGLVALNWRCEPTPIWYYRSRRA